MSAQNNCFFELHMVLLSKSQTFYSQEPLKVGKILWTWICWDFFVCFVVNRNEFNGKLMSLFKSQRFNVWWTVFKDKSEINETFGVGNSI